MQVAEYVQQREGDWYVGESHVSLHSMIAVWRRGQSPEDVQASFPHLMLVDIYGAITYYLAHQAELDAFFEESNTLAAERQAAAEAANPAFYADMRARIARVRPGVATELRAQGILSEEQKVSSTLGEQGDSETPSPNAPMA